MILPGLIILYGSARRQCSISDAFFLGWVINILCGMLLLPFSSTTEILSINVRIAVVVLCLVTLAISLPKQGFISTCKGWKKTIAVGFELPKVGIGIVVVVLYSLFAFSHNVGFDDIAHLDYLDKVLNGTVFPVYIDLVKQWQAARYPAFGMIIGVLGSFVKGSGITLYYLLALFLFIHFFIKVYEFVFERNRNVIHALGCTALIGGILVFIISHNYLNYGFYPLGGSKILFLTGILYVLFSRLPDRSWIMLLLGGTLLTTSYLHHLNLILLYVFTAPLLIIYLFVTKKTWKEWLLACCLCFISSAMIVPAMAVPGGGIVRYVKEPPVVVESTGEVKKRKKPSFFQKITLRVKQLLSWIKKGRYKNVYFERAFSLEMFFVPAIVLLFYYFTFYRLIVYCCIGWFIVAVGSETVRTVPKQLLVSAYRSGTVWFIADLLRSNIDLRSSKSVYTDGYSAIFLKLLGNKNVHVLEEYSQFIYFNPLIPAKCPIFEHEEVKRDADNGTLLLNGRFWGLKAVSRWKGHKRSHLAEMADSASLFTQNDSLSNLEPLLSGSVKVAKEQLTLPILVSPRIGTSYISQTSLLSCFTGDEIRIWRDTAIIPLNGIKRGQKIEVSVDYAGESVAIVAQISPNTNDPLIRADVPRWKKRMFLTATEQVDRLLLVIKADRGHFNGLGRIRSMKVSWLNESEPFRYLKQNRPD